MSPKDTFYMSAFEYIIQNSACSNFSEEFTVLYDEHFLTYLPAFTELANQKLMKVTYVYLPDSYQRVIQNNDKFYKGKAIQLPNGMRSAIQGSNVVLNFLTGSSESSKIRGSVLNYITDSGCRIIHTPLLSDDILEVATRSDFGKVHQDCELVAWALGNARNATIKTYSLSGQEFILEIPTDDWDNEPFISAGIVFENSWGNIMPGEAFWCPYDGNDINGQVCIDGSAPGYLFGDEDYLILTFKDGEVVAWEAPKNSLAKNYMENLLKETQRLKDTSWNKFAELGIGLNSAIRALTGNSLFDEKMAGTVHIALGDNECFGHDIESHFHHDLVMKRATLMLDDKMLIRDGMLDLDEIRTWRKAFVPPPQDIDDTTPIMFYTGRFNLQDGVIKRMLNHGNRIGHIDVALSANSETTTLLRNLFNDDNIDYARLLYQLRQAMNDEEIRKMIDTFVHYKMVELK